MQAKSTPEIFGHPAGLFTLFFAEMWERFSYYGMRALLTFYMIKGFLGLNDTAAYQIYGAYTALVYMTPYFGGMLADRLLGRRRAVVLGGLLMAAGHLLMTIENRTMFFTALAFLIVGNGFFKPNISTMVGELYPKASDRKDAGFTVFYMGINLGAALSPILCGYVGETFGWHYGFGLATGGMLIGVAIFIMPTRVTQFLIGFGALSTSIALPFLQDTLIQLIVRLLMAIVLLAAGAIAVRALSIGAIPEWVGAPPSMERLRTKVLGFIPADMAVYLGSILSVGIFAFIVQERQVAAIVLNGVGIIAFGYLLFEAIFRCQKVDRERLFVVVVLAVFHASFWAFFEQAGTSLNNWTDRNIDRVVESKTIAADQVGAQMRFRIDLKTTDSELSTLPPLTQEQLGQQNDDPAFKATVVEAIRQVEAFRNARRPESERVNQADIDNLLARVKDEPLFTMTGLFYLRETAQLESRPDNFKSIGWTVASSNVGMGVAHSEIPATEFQAANAVYILLFGLVFSALWTFLSRRDMNPSAPVKFALGLGQLGIGFMVFYAGALSADGRGMSSMAFLLIGWMLVTTGELCVSPVGLSMVTKLAPRRLVSTVMGVWFVSITYGNYISGLIATLTSPSQGDQSKLAALGQAIIDIFTGGGHGGGGLQMIPPPQQTVATYGDVFGLIGWIALGAALICFLLSWTLNRWMHPEVTDEG